MPRKKPETPTDVGHSALKHELPGRNKARAWQDEVKRVGERLSSIS